MSATFDIMACLARTRREPPLDSRRVAPADWQHLGDLIPVIELRDEVRRADPGGRSPSSFPRRRPRSERRRYNAKRCAPAPEGCGCTVDPDRGARLVREGGLAFAGMNFPGAGGATTAEALRPVPWDGRAPRHIHGKKEAPTDGGAVR